MESKNKPLKNMTQYRIHYKKNFKTVDQIAQEVTNDIDVIQNFPTTRFDFGLQQYFDFDKSNQEDSEYFFKI